MDNDDISDDTYESYEDYELNNNIDFISVMCLFFFSMTLIIVGLNYMNNSMNMFDATGTEYTIFKIVAGALLIAMAYYAGKNDMITEGMLIGMWGVSIFIFGLSAWYGFNGFFLIDVMIGIGTLVATTILFATYNILSGISSLLMAIAFLVSSLFNGDTSILIAGIALLVSGIVFLYQAIGNWIFLETEKDVLPVL